MQTDDARPDGESAGPDEPDTQAGGGGRGTPGQPAHGALTPALIEALRAGGRIRPVARGTVLVEEGTTADTFWIVLRGRFTVVAGGRPIAEIGPGEPIGEVAFFAGGARTADVIAARASEVVEIARPDYDALLAARPDLQNAIIAALAARLRATVPAAQALRPRPGQVIAVLPAGPGPLAPAIAERIAREVAAEGGAVLGPDTGDAHAALAASEAPRVALMCPDPEGRPDWAGQVHEEADTVCLVLDPDRPGAAEPSAMERRIAETFLAPSVHLAILRRGGRPAEGTAALLERRGPGLHHQVDPDSAADIARLGRFLRGEAMGIVFGGGGAFGTAHLGLLKALGEAGFAFDMVGGASIGSAMAAAYAYGFTPDEVLDRCDELFLTSRAMKRLTVPFHSVIDHAHFDAQLRHHYGERQIEDLPLNFFAVATSLTRNDLAVLRRGAVWRAVRASSAIPAVFPPMVTEEGEVLIDGAFMDNAPVETMRAAKPGVNLVLSLAQKKDWRVTTPYDALPGRAAALRRLALGRLGGRRVRFPGIFSVMTRAMIVNSEARLAASDQGEDIFLPIRPLPGMGFLEWEKGRRLYELSYARTAQALKEAGRGARGTDLLRAAARRVADGLGETV